MISALKVNQSIQSNVWNEPSGRMGLSIRIARSSDFSRAQHFFVHWLHPSRRGQVAAPLDEVSDLLSMRSQTLMVRSAATPRASRTMWPSDTQSYTSSPEYVLSPATARSVDRAARIHRGCDAD